MASRKIMIDNGSPPSSYYKSKLCAACGHTRGDHLLGGGVKCGTDNCECENFTYPAPEAEGKETQDEKQS